MSCFRGTKGMKKDFVFKRIIQFSLLGGFVLAASASALAQGIPGGALSGTQTNNTQGNTVIPAPGSSTASTTQSAIGNYDTNDPWLQRVLGSIYNLRVSRQGGQGCFQGPYGPVCASFANGQFSLDNNGLGGFGGPFVHPQIDSAACRVLGLPEGSFGALIMVAAGLFAIVAGALGAYKAALSTIAIGAGAWILRPIVSMFFPLSCGGIF